MAIPGGPGGPQQKPPPSGPPVVRDMPNEPGHGTPVQQPTQPTQTSSGGLVEVPGASGMPWSGTPVTAPRSVVAPVTPSAPTLDLSGISAARGVIGTIRQEATMIGVPVALALAVAKQESGFNQGAVSGAGAIGIMQLEPGTAQGLGVDPNNWKQNIEGGIRYLAMQYQRFGSWRLALAAYNAGPNAVANAGGVPSIPETQNYVKSVAAIAKQIGNGTFRPNGGVTGQSLVTSPLPGNPTVTSGFGPRGVRGTGDFHEGVDIAAPIGTPVRAMLGGTVIANNYQPGGAGHFVVVKDNAGRDWYYMHLQSPSSLKVGSNIQVGSGVGAVGASGMTTGPGLHLGAKMGDLGVAEKQPAGQAAVHYASMQIGTPYVWGGETPKKGFDCSGLVQWAYKQIGINIPRTSQEQFRVGKPVGLKDLQAGDLVFLEPGSSGPGHVVMYVGHGNVVAAPHTGTDVQTQTLKTALGDGFVGARRIIGNVPTQKWVNPMSVIRSGFNAGWGKTARISLNAINFLPPSAGGVNGSGQAVIPGGGGGYENNIDPTGLLQPQSVDAALTPGNGAAMPSNPMAWQQIINSGASSPETQALASQAGASPPPDQSLADVMATPAMGG